MLKIDANSWHFRLYAYYQLCYHRSHFEDSWDRRIMTSNLNLCKYFWSVVGALISFAWFYCIERPLAWTMGMRYQKDYCNYPNLKYPRQALYTIVAFLCCIIGLPMLHFNEGLAAISEVTIMISLIGFSIWGGYEIIDTYGEKISGSKASSFYTVAKEFIKTKKSNVCPSIEVVNLPIELSSERE
jgi:hypothetical protein